MGIHTLIGVESANRSLLMQTNSMHTMDDKLNMLLLFRQLDTPNDKELMQFVEARGGAQACLENDQILVELQSKLSTVRVNSDSMQQPKQSLDKLKKELNEDIDTALEENMIQFERKMKMQGEQLEALFRSESDRIIDAIHAGSYDRLIDQVSGCECLCVELHLMCIYFQDLKDLWKEMVRSHALHDRLYRAHCTELNLCRVGGEASRRGTLRCACTTFYQSAIRTTSPEKPARPSAQRRCYLIVRRRRPRASRTSVKIGGR